MVILYRTTKFKSANILVIAILGSTTKFNSRQYFRLYGSFRLYWWLLRSWIYNIFSWEEKKASYCKRVVPVIIIGCSVCYSYKYLPPFLCPRWAALGYSGELHPRCHSPTVHHHPALTRHPAKVPRGHNSSLSGWESPGSCSLSQDKARPGTGDKRRKGAENGCINNNIIGGPFP